VDLEHFEDVIRRRENHFFLVGEDHCLEDVDELRDVRHHDAIGMFLEDMQIKRGDEGVTERVLLLEKPGMAAGVCAYSAPFVDTRRTRFWTSYLSMIAACFVRVLMKSRDS